jgi:hypothetical protein
LEFELTTTGGSMRINGSPMHSVPLPQGASVSVAL